MGNIDKNNKLIAEFMGLKIITDGISLFDTNYSFLKKYNKDWNSLMEVIERIEALGFEFFIVESRCTVAHNDDNSIEKIVCFEIIGKKIEAAYKGVVDFIQYYNKSKE